MVCESFSWSFDALFRGGCFKAHGRMDGLGLSAGGGCILF